MATIDCVVAIARTANDARTTALFDLGRQLGAQEHSVALARYFGHGRVADQATYCLMEDGPTDGNFERLITGAIRTLHAWADEARKQQGAGEANAPMQAYYDTYLAALDAGLNRFRECVAPSS